MNSPIDDCLFYVDEHNQLLKVALALDGTDVESTNSEYVHGPFHQNSITGMDICLRKQLVVTCSEHYIMIWNWHERKFEMAWPCPIGEGATAVAFHPSGFHILAAVGDKIMMMNVLSNSMSEYHNFVAKGCREIRFSNGGHLFAASHGIKTHVYNFYTSDCPPNMICTGHNGKIMNIDWFEDDSGFADCCSMGPVYFYDLEEQRENQSRIKENEFKRPKTCINSIVNVPAMTPKNPNN